MEKVEKEILMELKECYENELVSALVGAGFSKNVSNLFLSWGELLHDMVEELFEIDITKHYDNYCHQFHCDSLDKDIEKRVRDEYISKICKHEDFLALTSQYIQKRGFRESIEAYIESRIPYATFNEKGKIVLKIGDENKEEVPEPNFSAHKELLSLSKLQNIYTTNYENLIEFTIEIMGSKVENAPNIVKSGRDLSDNIRNRNIIKIHGNLRTNQEEKINFDGDNKLQYIISKEDYETYKEKHEAFSSLMRIAMLQGKFMLLGFSGTDANYKGWVTWMSDVLEGEDGNVTKIYIIDVSGKDVPLDLRLYYNNHHTKVINLITLERLRAIGFEDKDISSIIEKQRKETLDNDTKRTILTNFLKFLKLGDSEGNEFINGDSQISPDEKESQEGKSVDVSTLSTFSLVRKELYEYRKLWQEALSKINDNSATASIVEKIKKAKPANRFPKIIYNQNYIIDGIVRKTKIDINDAFLLSLAIDECGLNPHYYSKLIKDYEELNKSPLWNLLKVKEETFNGRTTKLSGTDDEFIYENIQRSLFHLDFKEADDLIQHWLPCGYFIALKSMRLASQYSKQDEAFELLGEYIKKGNYPVLQLYAIQIANFISNKYPRPYDTEDFYQYGIDGIGDMLSFMIQQLRDKLAIPRTRGWIGSTMNFGESHPKYEKSLRILRFISDCGVYLNYGITNFMDKASWYLVFQNLYDEFPYPCFFYSIQYNDNSLLTRIGQDFAYSPKLSKFNKDILVKAIQAYGDCNTPQMFYTGLLIVIAPIYIAVDESLWFEVFKECIFNKLIKNFEKLDISDSLVKNVKHALVSLKKHDNIVYVLVELLTHYRENHVLADSFIRDNLQIRYIKNCVPCKVWSTLKELIDNYPETDITELFFFMEENEVMKQELKNLFCNKVIEVGTEKLPQDRSSSFYLCLLTKNNSKALRIAKKLLLKHDVWHCGIMTDGKGWSTPNYIRLNVFQDKIEWTDEEFNCIKDNLETNINKYKEKYKNTHEMTFIRNVQVEYLSDVLRFIDGLNIESRKQALMDVRVRTEELLNERVSYKTLIEGMLSEQSMDADYAMDNVIHGIKAKGLGEYLDEFNFMLDRAIMGDGLIINSVLYKIRIVVEEYSEEIISTNLCSKLYTLVSLYKERWSTYREFRPVWSFNHLYIIADFLRKNGYKDSDAVVYWLNDSFVQTFIRV